MKGLVEYLMIPVCLFLFTGCQKKIISNKREEAPTIREIVEPYVGQVPYRWGGESMTKGMDCSAFTKFVMRKVGVQLPRMVRYQAKRGYQVRRPKPGDLVFFDMSRRRRGLDHVGIYIGEEEFVHSTETRGVVIDKLLKYKHHLKMIRRVF